MGPPARGSLRARPQISIHPSRVGWDERVVHHIISGYNISIHPSRVGWDHSLTLRAFGEHGFQSTHPVWDGTKQLTSNSTYLTISIHPSRVGWDEWELDEIAWE